MATVDIDDFRIERRNDEWIVLFVPTGARFYFGDDGKETRVTEPERPPESQPASYDPFEVEEMAATIAYAARGHAT